MKALDRKLLRDLKRLWSQALTIALVVASGVGGFVTTLSAVDSLALARDRFYADGGFADVFAAVKRAPNALAEPLRAIPGVADVQTTLEHMVRIELPGVPDPIIGHLIGIDRRVPPRMNRIVVSSGRALDGDGGQRGQDAIEVLVSEGFAQAHGLKPGSRLQALINGRQRSLVVAGTALSPEYIFAGLWGMPDLRGFGVFWLDRDTLAAAYDMQGAFNRVAVKLAPGADEAAVRDALAQQLSRYGGREAQGRAEQSSHAMLDNEINEQRVLGTVLPAIFLGVAAFLLNVVVSRLVATQREQIAALKALGYGNGAIVAHYLKLVLLIVALGCVIGLLLGRWLGVQLTGLYAEFFRFPSFEHRIAPWLWLTSGGLSAATAVLGTFSAIAATVRLPPARSPPPCACRRPRRCARPPPAATGARCSSGSAVGNFIRDAIEVVVDVQFNLALRGDVSVWATDPLDAGVGRELARLPGVTQVEATRFVPVTLIHGPRRERALLRGYAGRAELYRVIDVAQRQTLLEGRGLVLTDRLAAKLGLAVGDRVQLRVLEGEERILELPVAGTVREMMGLNAYMDREALNRLLGDGDVAGGWVLGVERGGEAPVLDAIRGLPRVAGAWSKATMLRNMDEISARNVRIMSTIMTAFAAVIAVGVVYNNARIALAERAWELASLRVLGFTRAEVSAMLLGEMALLIAVALPLGMLFGWGLTHAITEALKSDQFYFPVVIRPRTYAWAAIAVVAAALASALVVRRHIDRLDLVAALKTRD